MSNSVLYKGGPCKGCEERYAGCHGKCEMYGTWKSQVNSRKEIIEKEKKKRGTMDDFAVTNSINRKKRGGFIK